MPYAVTHMLVPMVLIDTIRDKILKLKKKVLPNRYIILAGIFGLLPDIDIPISILIFKDISLHRTFTHTIWLPIAFLLTAFLFYFMGKKKWFKIFLMCFAGVFTHIILDFATAGKLDLFYPITNASYGLQLFPANQAQLIYVSMDALFLWLWFMRMEWKKRIQDIFE